MLLFTIFLDTKIKSADMDPNKRWVTTWNDYLNDIKCFLRWLFNEKIKKRTERDEDIVSRLQLFLESRRRREKEAVHIWKPNYGNVMTFSL
jgi:hypothetical protein